MNHPITSPEIPDEFVEFAKATADLACKHGIDKFKMTFRPEFDRRNKMPLESMIHGDMEISFSAVDGRGRPCRSLGIGLVANLTLIIERQQSSY